MTLSDIGWRRPKADTPTVTVFINCVAFLLLAWLLGWTRYRLEFLKREVEEAQALESLATVRR